MKVQNSWTKKEIKILERHYPILGMKVQQFLPYRTAESIEHKVRRLGIKYAPTGEGKAGYFDIETTGLQADFQYILSWSVKTANKNELKCGIVRASEQRDGTLDRRLVKEIIETLKEYNTIYTFYGTKFDIAFLRTRALFHNLDFIPYGLIQHKDLYYLVKRILRIHSNRLESVADLLGIKGKTHIEPRIWVKANSGDSKALQYILEHNKRDVILLEGVHRKLKDYEAKTRRFL